MRLLPAMRFRPAEPDRERYGDGWTTYDEAALTRQPARELIAIEREIGMPILDMLTRARQGHVDATLAATWVARRLAGAVEPYDQYDPLVLLMEWEQVTEAGDVDPPAPTSSPSGE